MTGQRGFVRPVREGEAAAALSFLDRLAATTGAAHVDEAEAERLRRLAAGEIPTDAATRWHPLLACGEDEILGYAGVVVDGGTAGGDLAVDPFRPRWSTATEELLDAVGVAAAADGARTLQLWIRDLDPEVEEVAVKVGFSTRRRLAVLGRGLHRPLPRPDLPGGVTLRSYEPGRDDDAVVAVLRAAYEGTPEAGWDLTEFERRREMPWFDPADLLVAEGRDGSIAGIHWTKRRGPVTGEVYNVAVAPDAQGLGLGRALLVAGLAHLRRRGCDDVVLWVDEDNHIALRLYTSEGFERRWTDALMITELDDDDN